MGIRNFIANTIWKFLIRYYRDDEEIMARLIGSLASRYFDPKKYSRTFQTWQDREVHITPVHYYYPIPDTRYLSEQIWLKKSKMLGINLNIETQLDLLRNIFPKYRDQYSQFDDRPKKPDQFYFKNEMFDGIDALTLYCMIRHFNPKTIIEVGSGFSTRIFAKAIQQNGKGKLICIEPYPKELLTEALNKSAVLIRERVENLDRQLFEDLEVNDVLFIDSSHIVKIGGDVNFLFLEIIPALKPGVLIHVHDIFFPNEYPKEWVKERLNFWTEQYLLQAFLSFNEKFEVLLSNNYLGLHYEQLLKEVFPNSPWWTGSSFWFRRKPE